MSTTATGLTLLSQTLRMAVPYVCAGLGGIWSERSGVVNIALEGILLAAALGASAADLASGNAWIGVFAGALVGAAVAAAHALIVVRGRVDAIVSGIAINLLAAGGTRFALQTLYASSSNSPPVPGFSGWFRGAGATTLLLRTMADPVALLAGGLVVATAWVLTQTRFGLRLRACGDDPHAAQSVGVQVAQVRVLSVAIGGAVAGLGGVALAYDQHRFDSAMSGGRGFIALAAVILSGWRPGRMALACLAFAALDAIQIVVQEETRVLGFAAQALPYAATLGVLWITARGGARGPAGLGKALED